MFARHSNIFYLTVLRRLPRQLLCRMAPASSSRDSASAFRDGGPIAAAGTSLASTWIILLALIIAAVSGGGRILKRRLQSRLDISALLPYARYRRFHRGPDKVSDTLTAADSARGGPAQYFMITRSWRDRNRSARQSGRGAAGS